MTLVGAGWKIQGAALLGSATQQKSRLDAKAA